MLTTAGKELVVLKDDAEVTEVKATTKGNYAVVEVELRPKKDQKSSQTDTSPSLELWQEKFKHEANTPEVFDYLWINVTAPSATNSPLDCLIGSELKVKPLSFNWMDTPIVKLLVSYESKGAYGAYNITGVNDNGNFKLFTSSFTKGEYDIVNMTISEIKTAQITNIGENKKHLFAVGIFQMIPITLKSYLQWITNYKPIKESNQLFNQEFQDDMPWFFWNRKRIKIQQYFQGGSTVQQAAVEVAKEWASAGLPNGETTAKGLLSDGTISYYEGDGVNKAHYSATKVIEALEQTKEMLNKAGGYDKLFEAFRSK